jgi:hypothetical protein
VHDKGPLPGNLFVVVGALPQARWSLGNGDSQPALVVFLFFPFFAFVCHVF